MSSIPERGISESRWAREDAIQFIQRISLPLAHAGYAVGLLGSVLYKGFSKHDLDIVLIPLDQTKTNYERLCAYLQKVGMTRRLTRMQVTEAWRKMGSNDTKHVEVWETEDGLRVDVFFWGQSS